MVSVTENLCSLCHITLPRLTVLLGETDMEVSVEVHKLIFPGISIRKNYVRMGRKTKTIYLNNGNITPGIAVLVGLSGHNKILLFRGLNNRNEFSYSSGSWKSKLRVLADSVPGGSSFSSSQRDYLLLCPHVAQGEWRSSWALIKTLIPLEQGLPLRHHLT